MCRARKKAEECKKATSSFCRLGLASEKKKGVFVGCQELDARHFRELAMAFATGGHSLRDTEGRRPLLTPRILKALTLSELCSWLRCLPDACLHGDAGRDFLGAGPRLLDVK